MRYLVLTLIALVGCYSPTYEDCNISCASGICPSGLECHENVCRTPGFSGACSTMPNVDAAADASVPFDMLFGSQISALCTAYVRCGEFEDQATCEHVLTALLTPPQDLIDAVTKGAVTYHPDHAQACLDATKQLSCTRFSVFNPLNQVVIPECIDVFTGMVGDLGSCLVNEQCTSQICTKGNCPNACCAGTCSGGVAPGVRNTGAPCTARDSCMNGYCDGATKTCIAYKVANDACANSGECGSGLLCSANNPRHCQAMVATNGACSTTSDCLNLADLCTTGTCKPSGLNGTTCNSNSECQLDHMCSAGAGVPGQCRQPPMLGESCQSFSLCLTGYCNGAAVPMCVAKLANGQPCVSSMAGRDCMSGYCMNGVCNTKPACF